MEASVAGQAPAAAEGQAAEGQNPEAPQVDINEWQQNVDARLGDALDGIRQMAQGFETLQSRIPEPAPEAEPNFDEQFQQLFEETGYNPDPGQLQNLVQQQAEAIAQKMIAPVQQQLSQFQEKMTSQELGALQNKFPELADAKVADGLANEVVTRAEQWGVPQLANSAEFVEMVHRDMQSRNRAQQETPVGQGSIPQIESGGGAAPNSDGGDEWDSFVQKTGGNRRVW